MLFKTDAEKQSYGIGRLQTLFGLLVIPVVLYGCEVWASSTSDLQWKQIEKIQKRLITNKFKIKSSVSCDIMLSEMGVAPTEAIAMVCLIRYLKKLSKWKTVGGLRSSLMTYCAKGRRRG
jgi:hypothetical protein